ncbi:MAG TPA: family 43 glycosylhydrolase [Microthrixaceae bacterium]|nr:family 43 glycosylhydrolase [Microthrixaceae bacterium]MCB9399756.1 family 43 glycosylhydrolase [Microthrixaceae bacterium]MCC6183840.1 family 43 glycosylhydrolase [Microthrixaceae bacterium]MCO5306807.1 family 43 glycosylhydrolase [Microthrixaceae bacterium]HMX07567.1 family 43 glycosylhydrolase [Microthrixaceae bacterium]
MTDTTTRDATTPEATDRPRRRHRRAGAATIALVGAIALLSGCQVPLGPVTKVGVEAVRLPETSDPFVLTEGGAYYVYGSNSHVRAPVTRLTDLSRPYNLWDKNAVTTNAMPTAPAWAANPNQFWAPSVARFGDHWVMYFSTDRIGAPDPANPQCVGRAIATSPMGPFVADPVPMTCGLGDHGALDPDVFTDAEGRRWLYVAFGGTETPIHVFALDGNGWISGWPTAVLGRQYPWEYHFIENPSMVYDRVRRNYLLSYSAGRWYEAAYRTGIARCATPTGPCTSDPTGPWLASSNGRTGPGGLSFFTDLDGAQRAIYASFAAGLESTNGGRSASIVYLRVDPSVTLSVVK